MQAHRAGDRIYPGTVIAGAKEAFPQPVPVTNLPAGGSLPPNLPAGGSLPLGVLSLRSAYPRESLPHHSSAPSLPAGGCVSPGASPIVSDFLVGDAVKVWSVSSHKWYSDGKVFSNSGEGVKVEFEGGTLLKLIPHELLASGVLVRLQVSDFAAGDQVALWSDSRKAWFNDGAVEAVTGESVVVIFNGGSLRKEVPPSQVHKLLRKGLYNKQDPVKYQHELMGALREMLRAYAKDVGDTDDHANETFEVLQRQAFNCNEWEALSHCDHKEVAKIAIVLWTSAEGRVGLKKPFCNILNHVLREDSGDALRHAVAFTRAMTSLMVNPARGQGTHSLWPDDLVSHRGTRMPRNKLDFFVKDKFYRVPMFLSTSFYEKQAYVFLRNVPESELVPVMFRFVLDPVRLCDHAMYIESMSQLHDEHELLYAPYSAFRVISIKIPEGKISWDQPAIIEIAVQPNNASVPEDLPLAAWH